MAEREGVCVCFLNKLVSIRECNVK